MTYRIQFESGEAFAFSADEDTLLRGALRAGLGFPNDCGVGGCGNCRFELVSGGDGDAVGGSAGPLGARAQARPAARLPVEARGRLRRQGPPRRRVSPGGSRSPASGDPDRACARSRRAWASSCSGPRRRRGSCAGQFAILHPPGVAGARAYSMSNLPNDAGEWRFVIRRDPRRPGSNAMFDALRLGEVVDNRRPLRAGLFSQRQCP